jgi:hypothetical protein
VNHHAWHALSLSQLKGKSNFIIPLHEKFQTMVLRVEFKLSSLLLLLVLLYIAQAGLELMILLPLSGCWDYMRWLQILSYRL